MLIYTYVLLFDRSATGLQWPFAIHPSSGKKTSILAEPSSSHPNFDWMLIHVVSRQQSHKDIEYRGK